MLFNSYEFIFIFLPITYILYFFLNRIGQEIALCWLVIASLFFYAWWNPNYLPLISISMVANFLFGRAISKNRHSIWGKYYLATSVALNVFSLCYFKYAGFLVSNVNSIANTAFTLDDIILPLAISFFTFQQIAYLVDSYRGVCGEYRFLHYALFVTFFPQLIAGPIVHHSEMMPQFMKKFASNARMMNIVIGLTIFGLGLFKKVVLADGVAQYASPVFATAENGEILTFFEAWGGALAYTFQLYFDFSGYSDMAIGAARLFGIRLPLNFHSPYKSTSIIEFWRRWHMTLSRFLRDYLYIPLGGSKKGNIRRYTNLMTTMLLGGLWHGAGWTFVVWGGLHGCYLIINHAWDNFCRAYVSTAIRQKPYWRVSAWFITFLAVVVGWVFFRATSFESAIAILQGMAGLNGVALPNNIVMRLGSLGDALRAIGFTTYLGGGRIFAGTYLWIFALFIVALFMPNTQEFMRKFKPALQVYESSNSKGIQLGYWAAAIIWRPSKIWAAGISIICAFGILALTNISEFLYFQF